MRKHILLILLSVFFCSSKAQNLAFYFELIPDAQLPQLRQDMLKGMIGLYDLGQRPASVPNLLNGTCTLDTLSNDYLSMHTSNVSTLSIKMLNINNEDVLVVINTVKAAGTEDSSIKVFTTTWSKLDTSKYLTLPTHKDFYKENDSISLEEFTHYCRPLLISYSFEGEKLIAKINPESYLTREDYKKILPGLNESVVISF